MTHERWGATDEPSKNGQLCSPDDIDRPMREAARKKVLKYQNGVPAALQSAEPDEKGYYHYSRLCNITPPEVEKSLVDCCQIFLIVGGLYSVTAWRENDQEGYSVY